MTITEMWDELISIGVSEETLQCITSINGYRTDVLEDVLYWKTGYNSFEQYMMEN